MAQPSMTGTDSFRLRMQRSETSRASLMAGVYSLLLFLSLFRRVTGGIVMADNRVFGTFVSVLAAATAYSLYVVFALRAASRENRIISGWKLNANASFELLVPIAGLLSLHLYSARGPYAALSAPILLLIPLTVLMSVLRLRARTTLWLGLGGAVFHAMLVTSTIWELELPHDQYAVLYNYPAILALIGIGGAIVTSAVRRYLKEAVEQAEAHERTGLRLAGIQHDLEIARQIQTGLLPSASPEFPGFDLAGMNQPADQTGGDYYDWQELPNGRLLAVLADVTGHGIGPALVMAICRAYARASAPLDSNPSSLMARLNDLLHADMTTGRFITLAMAVLDRGGDVELVSAGHGPSLLYRASNRGVEQFGGDGLPLAVMPEESYGPSRQFTMLRGDILVMLTDGVFEWQNSAGVQFGTQVLDRVLSESSALSAAQIVEALHHATIAHAAGTKQMDDVTIVVIKRTV